MQLTSVITAPTERSRPPASTGTVWAMATMTRARLSLVFWISTAAREAPRMQGVVDAVEHQEEQDGQAEAEIAADHGARACVTPPPRRWAW